MNGWAIEANRKLEETLMKSYNRKHRPVKKDSTTMQIQIYLLIGHIEKVVLFLRKFSKLYLFTQTWYLLISLTN